LNYAKQYTLLINRFAIDWLVCASKEDSFNEARNNYQAILKDQIYHLKEDQFDGQ
jgi:hypothetical protein